ncbi:MAG: NAD(P)H-binding protein [Boseongicola sp.]|nr:NAD(P)H-binding protein [Boseongicola sp.]
MKDPLARKGPLPKRVLVTGATGTAGRAVAIALIEAGHHVTCLVRPESTDTVAPGARLHFANITDAASLRDYGFAGEAFDVVVSCIASRTGAPADAWAIDHDANVAVLEQAKAAGVGHFVLLSAICVQKPLLAFQHAKLAFEEKLVSSGLDWSIVRPTAFFKSLSGQIARVKAGKPYLMFGDGELTACKPISDRDLGAFIAGCIDAPKRRNRILPIGGPGPALTPLDMGREMFRLTGQPEKFRKVPVALLDVIAGGLKLAGLVKPGLRLKADLARIGRYYATESMLLYDAKAGAYDADATPEFGSERLFDYYADVVAGRETVDLREQAVF